MILSHRCTYIFFRGHQTYFYIDTALQNVARRFSPKVGGGGQVVFSLYLLASLLRQLATRRLSCFGFLIVLIVKPGLDTDSDGHALACRALLGCCYPATFYPLHALSACRYNRQGR
jgi:hypothetical protein